MSSRVCCFLRSRRPGLTFCVGIVIVARSLGSLYHRKGAHMSSRQQEISQDSLTDRADGPRVALPFVAVVLAMLPAVLDQTILATSLPVIARELGSLTDVSWVVTAYVVAAAATTPLWGKLGDRLGRKRLLEISLGLFV